MPSVALLWLLSAVMAVAIVAVLVALLLLRGLGPSRESRSEARRLRLVVLLSKAKWDKRDEVRLRDAPPALVADVCIELLNMVRGDEKARLVEAGRRAGVADVLGERLKSWSHGVRLGAAGALGDFVDNDVAGRLREALDDAVPAVRLAAAISLASAGRAPPLRLLIEKLELGTAECSRFILRLFRDRAAADPAEVIALLTGENVSTSAKAYAAEALGAEGNYEAVPVISALALDERTDPEDVVGYVQVLGELAHPGAATAIERSLRSPHWRVRAAAADAAGKIRLSATVDVLADLLDDPHWLVRLQAGEALGKLGAAGDETLRAVSRGEGGPAQEAARMELVQQSQ